MKLFSRKERIPSEDLTAPPPSGGIRRFFFLLHNHFGKLVSANLLFLLFSLPVITLPGSLCALNRVCVQLSREGNCYVWDAFWEEFKASVWRGMPVGLCAAVCLASASYSISLGAVNTGVARIAFTALGLGLLFLTTPAFSYAFILLPSVHLPLKAVFRNALALSLVTPGRSLLVFVLKAACAALLPALYPFSVLLHGLFLIALSELAVVLALLPAIDKYVIVPDSVPEDEADGPNGTEQD